MESIEQSEPHFTTVLQIYGAVLINLDLDQKIYG